MVTDLADDIGIHFAELEPASIDAIAEHLDDGLEAENPLDAWGTHENFEARFEASMKLLVADPRVGGGAFFSNFRDRYYLSEAIYDAVAAAHAAVDKPVALINCYADLDDEQILLLEDGHCLRDHTLAACKIRAAQALRADEGLPGPDRQASAGRQFPLPVRAVVHSDRSESIRDLFFCPECVTHGAPTGP